LLSDGREADAEALAFLNRAIAAAETLGTVPPSDLGAMLNRVALIHSRNGRGDAAERHYLRALELYDRAPGPDPAEKGAILNNLGVFYTRQGRLEEAERVHQRALAIRQNARPPGPAEVAHSACNLAAVYQSRGDFEHAGQLYQESLRSWEAIEQPSSDYVIAASNYADLLRSLGKNRKAATIESRARKRCASAAGT
jgi:tetratricopeptide (TPR) repeat protein